MKIFLPTLYKKTNSGSIQYWTTYVRSTPNPDVGLEHAEIWTEFGHVDTKNPQMTHDLVSDGKNTGKKNATTPFQQAEKEARSKWQKQIDSGYVNSIEKAEAGETSRSGVECMLAHEYGYLLNDIFYPDQAKKAKFPAALQPKLDGIRSPTATDGTLKSREHKPINSVPHIPAELARLDLVLIGPDGELYNHEYKEDFEKITSIVNKKNEVDSNHTIVQYHIYDLSITTMGFSDRQELLKSKIPADHPFLKVVPTHIVNNHEEIVAWLKHYRALGYEGVMVRNLDSPYEGKRSYNLLKFKEFFEEEFEIVSYKEGRGKLQGHLGAWICKCGDKTFDPPMKCSQARKKELWETKEQFIGKKLTVRFQGYTAKNKVPRFPEGIRFREEGF